MIKVTSVNVSQASLLLTFLLQYFDVPLALLVVKTIVFRKTFLQKGFT